MIHKCMNFEARSREITYIPSKIRTEHLNIALVTIIRDGDSWSWHRCRSRCNVDQQVLAWSSATHDCSLSLNLTVQWNIFIHFWVHCRRGEVVDVQYRSPGALGPLPWSFDHNLVIKMWIATRCSWMSNSAQVTAALLQSFFGRSSGEHSAVRHASVRSLWVAYRTGQLTAINIVFFF